MAPRSKPFGHPTSKFNVPWPEATGRILKTQAPSNVVISVTWVNLVASIRVY